MSGVLIELHRSGYSPEPADGPELEAWRLGAGRGEVSAMNGEPPAEILREFEAWMAGHCWRCGTWTPGHGYSDQMTRLLWAAWRDCTTLANWKNEKSSQLTPKSLAQF